MRRVAHDLVHGALKERGVTAHVLSTRKAMDLYNKLAEDQPVGGLFHSTC